jgi:hypothetical protein
MRSTSACGITDDVGQRRHQTAMLDEFADQAETQYRIEGGSMKPAIAPGPRKCSQETADARVGAQNIIATDSRRNLIPHRSHAYSRARDKSADGYSATGATPQAFQHSQRS